MHTTKKILVYEACKKDFGLICCLKLHLQIHNPVKRYICEVREN